MVPLAELFDWESLWDRSRASWHYPQLPKPVLGQISADEFPFSNYRITLGPELLGQGGSYVENLFHHLIVHYIFCPRSLEASARLAMAASKAVKDPLKARAMVNIFSDIVTDSFRLERSQRDQELSMNAAPRRWISSRRSSQLELGRRASGSASASRWRAFSSLWRWAIWDVGRYGLWRCSTGMPMLRLSRR
jgi:hypothetical protein